MAAPQPGPFHYSGQDAGLGDRPAPSGKTWAFKPGVTSRFAAFTRQTDLHPEHSGPLTIDFNGEFAEGFFMALDELIDSSSAAASVASLHEAEYIFRLSQGLVPVDTGQLKLSGRIETDEEDEEIVAMNIMYGGEAGSGRNTEDVDYAVVVHEDWSRHHVPPGQAKFLEMPALDEDVSGRSVARMRAEIERSLAVSMGQFAGRGGSWLRGANGRFVGSIR